LLVKPITFLLSIYSITKNETKIVISQIINNQRILLIPLTILNTNGYLIAKGDIRVIDEINLIILGFIISVTIDLSKSVVAIPIVKPEAATKTLFFVSIFLKIFIKFG
jgi:hypothetical protein